MDAKLLAWARAVKRRQGRAGKGHPPLWVFSDPVRCPDLPGTLRRLPRGLCGLVFRHDGAPGRAALGRAVAEICRGRGIAAVSAGPAVPGMGLHLRGGRRRRGPPGLRTASAHGVVELLRARRAGASLVFLSPAFPTASHPGAPALGAVRWAGLARKRETVLALGGIDGRSVQRLPRWAAGAGAIGAFSGT